MKILAIRGANLASLAREFELDLANGALGGSGLFAIVGNTGAGKSTLLDALCVALFDRTPRISERTRNAVLIGRGSDEATKVSAHDVRAILRRGAGRGFAEVDFQGDDGRRYRARWEVHRARDKAEGALQNQVMSLVSLDDEARLGGTKTETLTAIEERLGLSFDQFRRSALLAQGDFAAFLRADGKDRSELLERMTGTEIYSQLSMAAHKRGQLAEARIKELGLSMAAIEVLSDEAQAALRGELAAAIAGHEGEKRALAEAERAARWWQQHGRLAQELGEAEREHAAATETEQAASGMRREQEVRRRGEALRPAWQAAQRAVKVADEREERVKATEAALATAQQAAEQAREARLALDEILAPVREVREAIRLAAPATVARPAAQLPSLDQLAVRVTEPVEWLAARRHLYGLAAAWPEIQAMEVRDNQLRQTAAALEHKAQRLRSELDQIAAKRAQLDQQRTRARKALDEATQRAAANAPAASHNLSLETAAHHEDLAREQVAKATRLHDAMLEARAAAAAIAELAERKTANQATTAAAKKALTALEKALSKDAAALTEAEAALVRMNTVANLAHARAQLLEGEPCPLCGAEEHPWAGRGALDELVVEQGAAVTALRARISDGKNAELEHKLTLGKARQDAETLTVENAEAKQRAQAAGQAWSAALVELGELPLVTGPSGEDADELVAEHTARAKRALDKARTERGKLQTQSKAAQNANAVLVTKRHDLEQVDLTLEETDRQRQRVDDQIAACEREAAGQKATRHELAATLVKRLESWKVSREAIEQERALVFEELRIAVDGWHRNVDRLLEYEAALVQHSEQSAQALEHAQAKLTTARANLETYQRERKQARAELVERTAELSRDCAAAGLSEAQLAELMDAPAERLHQLGEALGELSRRSERARSLVEERRRAMAAHEGERPVVGSTSSETAHLGELAATTPSTTAAPTLSATAPTMDELLNLRQRAAAAEERVLALRSRTESDDAARQRRAGMGEQVLAAERAGEVDRSLAQAIGSHDGKLLRAFAQSLTLDTLLELANHHLDELAPRYQLERVPRYDLELQVIDRDMGDEVRAVQSLSGGESFLVSLALALALSSLAAGSVRVRTLLIDEGFGTLDPSTLDGALAVLDALQATGRQVGIISHIPGLLERVGAHVKVVQRGNGRSDVVIAAS